MEDYFVKFEHWIKRPKLCTLVGQKGRIFQGVAIENCKILALVLQLLTILHYITAHRPNLVIH
jgi:hypothetical protein